MANEQPAPARIKAVVLDTHGIPNGMTIKTPHGMPDIIVKAVSPVKRTTIRVSRVYFQSLLGFLPITMGAGQAIADQIAPGKLVLPTQFWEQLLMAAALAIAPSVTALLTNLVEWLVKQDSANA